MELTALVLIAATLFGWALVSARLQQADLTAPVVFTAVGAAMAWSGMLDVSSPPEAVTPVVEIPLVWVLFSDAARLPLQQLRRDVGRYVRLLGIGLPLTIVFGWLLAAWFFPQFGLWLALLVGAALAPTDAAPGASSVTKPSRPNSLAGWTAPTVGKFADSVPPATATTPPGPTAIPAARSVPPPPRCVENSSAPPVGENEATKASAPPPRPGWRAATRGKSGALVDPATQAFPALSRATPAPLSLPVVPPR